MTSYRLGTLTAAVFALGWVIALAITLIFWLPQLIGVDPLFYEQAERVLPFVAANPLSWQIFHLATTSALIAAIPLISHLSHLHPDEAKQTLLRPLGLTGASAALIASLIDQFSTPYLAQIGAGNITFAIFIWETIEPFRDNGLKTISFLLLGLWMLWLTNGWEGDAEKRPRQLTHLTGWGLLLLGLIEAAVPLPLKNIIGETGFGGLVLILLPIWGFTVAHWFWQQELARVNDQNIAPPT